MNVIITGASAGIGFELTKQFIADPSITTVIGIARRSGWSLPLEAFERTLGFHGKFILVVSDVIEVSLEEVNRHVQHVHILINNAGLLKTAPFQALTESDFLDVYRTNVFAPAHLIRELSPLLGGAAGSHIVNIGSMGGFQGSSKFAGLSAYSSSKAALACLTECLAEEFKEDNIKVNCLAIGAVQTEMLAQAFPGFIAPVTAIQMASYIKDFSCNAHHYYNGKVLPVSLSTP